MIHDRLPAPVLARLRHAKHLGARSLKHLRWGLPLVRGPLFEPYFVWKQRRNPQTFPREKYAGEWFAQDLPGRSVLAGEPVPRRIFVIWAGENPMSQARVRNLEEIRTVNHDLEIVLVTPDTLGQWVLPDAPLPAEYANLSFVHRADYLRCYLLHHHGGGYIDLKRPLHPWRGAFERLEASDAWLLGYTERSRLNIPAVGGELYRDLRGSSQQLFGYGGLIARRHTALSSEWERRARAVLATHGAALEAHPGNDRGDSTGYPIAWTELLAHIVAPLTWKYQDHVLHDDRVLPELRRYM
ncbi:MAG: hypothetical protein IPL94_03795 [Tetrasphaera sp.]|nr:hypothetical protein [Tetrasphaera sp.]